MILVSGGTGFVGKEIIRQLLNRGYKIRVLCRHIPKISTEFADPQIEFFIGNVADADSLDGCCDGVQGVIHLVGMIQETPRNTFQSVHIEGTSNLLGQAQRAGVKRWIQMSAAGTRPNAASRYHQTKWEAEELVRASGLDWTICRPSIIFGAQDRFTNLFASLFKESYTFWTGGAVGVFGDGENTLQFIAVEDVAHCFVGALGNPLSIGKTLDLCGERFTFNQMLEKIAFTLGFKLICLNQKYHDLSILWAPWYLLTRRRPLLFSIPLPLGYATAGAIEVIWEVMHAILPSSLKAYFNVPPLTIDMLMMLQENQNADCMPAQKLFRFTPRSFSEGIQSYLSKN